LRNINDYWCDEFRRYWLGRREDKGEFYLNLQDHKAGRAMVERANGIAQERGDARHERKSDWWSGFACNSYEFAKAISELAMASMFGLDINHHLYDPLPHGIAVRPTLYSQFSDADMPILQEPFRRDIGIDRHLVYANCVVLVGPDPLGYINKSRALHKCDWWSYQPIAVIFTGFTSAAHVLTSDLCKLERIGWQPAYKPVGYTVHVNDLLPPHLFREYLAEAPAAGEGYRDLRVELRDTGQAALPLPNHHTALFNRSVEEALTCPPYGYKFSNPDVRVDPQDRNSPKVGEFLEDFRATLKDNLRMVTNAKRVQEVNYVRNRSHQRKRHNERMKEIRAMFKKKRRKL